MHVLVETSIYVACFPPRHQHVCAFILTLFLCFQNRPTGDCNVQMSTVEAASKAADRLHRRNMGWRYIKVFQVRRGGKRREREMGGGREEKARERQSR